MLEYELEYSYSVIAVITISLVACPCLQDKGENCTTTLWIILEFLPVVTVLTQSPNSHLESASECK